MHDNQKNVDTLVYAIHELICGEVDYASNLTALADLGIPAFTTGIRDSHSIHHIPIHPNVYIRSIPDLASIHRSFASTLSTRHLSTFLNHNDPVPLIHLMDLIQSIASHYVTLVASACVLYSEYSAGFSIALKLWNAAIDNPSLSKRISGLAKHPCLICDHMDHDSRSQWINLDSLLSSPIQRITRYPLLWSSIKFAWIKFSSSSLLFSNTDPSSLNASVSAAIEQALVMSNQLALFVDGNKDSYDQLCRSFLFWNYACPQEFPALLNTAKKPSSSPGGNPGVARKHSRAKSMDNSDKPFLPCFDRLTRSHRMCLDAMNKDHHPKLTELAIQFKNKALESIHQWWDNDHPPPNLAQFDPSQSSNNPLSLVIGTGMFLLDCGTRSLTRASSLSLPEANMPPLPKVPSEYLPVPTAHLDSADRNNFYSNASSPILHGSTLSSASSGMWLSMAASSRDMRTSPPTVTVSVAGQQPEVDPLTYYAVMLFRDGTLVAAVPSPPASSLDSPAVANINNAKYQIRFVWQLLGSTHRRAWCAHELVDSTADQQQYPGVEKPGLFGLRLCNDEFVLDLYSRSLHVRNAWLKAFQSVLLATDVKPLATKSNPPTPCPEQVYARSDVGSPVIDIILPSVHDLAFPSEVPLPPSPLECVSLNDPPSFFATPRKPKSSYLWSGISRVVSRRARPSSLMTVHNKEADLDYAFAKIFSFISGQNNFNSLLSRASSVSRKPALVDSGNCSPPSNPYLSNDLFLPTAAEVHLSNEGEFVVRPRLSSDASVLIPPPPPPCCTPIDKSRLRVPTVTHRRRGSSPSSNVVSPLPSKQDHVPQSVSLMQENAPILSAVDDATFLMSDLNIESLSAIPLFQAFSPPPFTTQMVVERPTPSPSTPTTLSSDSSNTMSTHSPPIPPFYKKIVTKVKRASFIAF